MSSTFHVNLRSNYVTCIELEVLQKVKAALSSTYRYSAGRTHRLHEVETILDDTPILKLVEHHSVRWLSLGNCVQTFFRIWPTIVTCLESDAANDPFKTRTAAQMKAKGILDSVRIVKSLMMIINMFD